MSKLLGLNIIVVLLTAAVLIASLVFNIITYNKLNTDPSTPSTTPSPPVTTPLPTTFSPGTPGCTGPGKVSSAKGWKDAASQLLRGLDRTRDPCDDFYLYSCSAYLANSSNPPGPANEAQTLVNLQIAQQLESIDEKKATMTEQIAKKAYQVCVKSMLQNVSDPSILSGRVQEVQKDLVSFIDFPLFGIVNSTTYTWDIVFQKMGRVERQFVTSILLGSSVSVDYKNKNKAAYYMDQAGLSYPRDYYVLPQYISILQQYANDTENLLQSYSEALNITAKCATSTGKDCIKETIEWMVDFERQIAMASWPGSEQRNYQQQYNPYNLNDLPARFPSLPLKKYINAILDGIMPDPFTNNVVVDQPTYFSWLDAKIASGDITPEQIVNYLAITFLAGSRDYHMLGMMKRPLEDNEEPGGLSAIQPPAVRNGKGTRKLTYVPQLPVRAVKTPDSTKSYCVEMLIVYIPYAPGYVYVKNRKDRDDVKQDVETQTQYIVQAFSEMLDTLTWMTDDTKTSAHDKLSNLKKNIGWPDWFGQFGNSTDEGIVDDYHVDYNDIINDKTYWEVSRIMKYGMETREFFRQLNITGETRDFFLQSPAMVNAWYQPERNSITIPLANLNPPYYSLNFPQAYNFAGQGGTAGHELTHGYDDNGVQFGPTGELTDCSFTRCGWMKDESRAGFVDMAQCVVTQFSRQCCPVKTGNVRCANGVTTQGENIADIGGQQAAYRAYQAYIEDKNNGKTEDLLPGLEDFTPNQIFWLSYGYSWCSKKSTQSIISQIMTDVHSPSSCRVNQVMQDIPQFGREYKCQRKTPMYPVDSERCKVWIGF